MVWSQEKELLGPETEYEQHVFAQLAAGLADFGYCVLPNALPTTVSDCLASHLAMLGPDDFTMASTGRGSSSRHNPFVRQNGIHWLDDEVHAIAAWHHWTLSLKDYLNRRLFLGLFSFEAHLTRYDHGGFYRRHLDAFKGERNRVVSLVTYLNEGWQPDQGGELVLYPEGEERVTVTPLARTVVVFLSEEMPHEVMPTRRTRHGIAGWFHLNTSINTAIDPPR